MDRCKVKPCKDSSFGTHKEFQDNFLGKIVSGYAFNYALCKIIEHVYSFTVPGSKKWIIRTPTTKL